MYPARTCTGDVSVVFGDVNCSQSHASCFLNLSDEVAAVDDVIATGAMHLVVTAADYLVVVDVSNLLVGEDSFG